MKKQKIECGREGCGYGVKKAGDFCKKHQEPVIIPAAEQKRGIDDGPMLPVRYVSKMTIREIESATVADSATATLCDSCAAADVSCPIYPQETQDCIVYSPKEIRHDDQQAGARAEIGAGHEAHSAVAGVAAQQTVVSAADDDVVLSERQDLDGPTPACLACEGPVNGQDLFCSGCIPDDFEIPLPVGLHTQEQATPCPNLSPPLAALVVEPEPPLPETAVVLDLGEMYETLVGQGGRDVHDPGTARYTVHHQDVQAEGRVTREDANEKWWLGRK